MGDSFALMAHGKQKLPMNAKSSPFEVRSSSESAQLLLFSVPPGLRGRFFPCPLSTMSA
jgi:hypothetical protein